MTAMREGEMEFYCDLLVGGAYFIITAQLLLLVTNDKVVSLFGNRRRGTNSYTLFLAAGATAFLFAAFICLCGASHIISALCRLLPGNQMAVSASAIIMVLCAVVSVITAVVSFALFPVVANALTHVELDSDGKLQLAESYMVKIVNMLRESVVVLSPDAKVIRGNDISRTIFGNNFLGLTLTDIVHREDRSLFERTLQQVLSSYNDSPVSIEYRISASEISKSNNTTGIFTTTWVESTFCRGMNTNADGQLEYDVKMITRNIDDRKRGAKYRQYYQDAKEREIVNEAKLRYISCVAHDLKTPLQSFTFTTELLKQTELSAEQSELLEQANVAVDLMKLTISQTMDISKALTGAKLVPRRIPVLLSSIIDRVRIIIHGYGKQVPVSFRVTPAINDAIITDEEWLWQMLLNLLTNSCKYTDRGSIEVRVSLSGSRMSAKTQSMASLSPRPSSASRYNTVTDTYVPTSSMSLLFEVADTGVGIRDDKLDSMFDAFSQVQSGQVTGTGLGLFGLRRRVEGLNGTYGARHNTDSPTGTGTVVWFTIPYVIDRTESLLSSSSNEGLRVKPAAEVAALCKSNGSPSAISQMVRHHKLSAIIVDDTLTIRRLMEKFLLQLGFDRVSSCENGSKGLTAITQQQVDFVFTDIQMPIMTGPEMARRFRLFEAEALRAGTRTKRQLIVAVSANQPDAPQSPGEGEGSGDFDFVCAKPLSREDLTRLLLHYLANNIATNPGAEESPSTDDGGGGGGASASAGVGEDNV